MNECSLGEFIWKESLAFQVFYAFKLHKILVEMRICIL